MTKVQALKKLAVALRLCKSTEDLTGQTIGQVLKEMGVKVDAVKSVDEINCNGVAHIMSFIADKLNPPTPPPVGDCDLKIKNLNCTVTVTRHGEPVGAGQGVLKIGDEIVISAEVEEGYEITEFICNGSEIKSDYHLTVTENVTIAAKAEPQKLSLSRNESSCTITVTRNGEPVSDDKKALNYGDEIVITATANQGFIMSSLTVNGKDFGSGSSMKVTDHVTISGSATPHFKDEKDGDPDEA